ncbi:MAG: hypothetical protein AAF675_18115 [Pseudomonadota bacterium]
MTLTPLPRRLLGLAGLVLLAVALPVRAEAPAFFCSGIGEEAAEEEATFPHTLKLIFAQVDGKFIADVDATIMQGSETVLTAFCPSPWLLVDLPEGRYTVTATHAGVTKSTAVSVKSGRVTDQGFGF